MTPRLTAAANLLAFALPSALILGALASQYIGGLYPCEMCHWQRWPHYAAIVVAGVAFFVPPPLRAVLVALAGFAILTSGALGVYHAGVEYHWWEGITTCSSTAAGTSIADLMAAPLVRCDAAQWTLGGVSLAGFNALLSLAGGIAILAMLAKEPR